MYISTCLLTENGCVYLTAAMKMRPGHSRSSRRSVFRGQSRWTSAQSCYHATRWRSRNTWCCVRMAEGSWERRNCPSVHSVRLRSLHAMPRPFQCRSNDNSHQVDEWCMTVCSTTRSKIKVKVTSPRKSEIRPFSKATSSSIYNGAGKWPQILKLGGNTYSVSGPDF